MSSILDEFDYTYRLPKKSKSRVKKPTAATLFNLSEEGKRTRDLDTFLDRFFEQSSAIRRLEGLE